MALSPRIRSTRTLVVGLVVASLLTITLDFRAGESGPLAAIGRGVLTVIGPLQEGVSKAFHPVVEFFSNIANAQRLRADNERFTQRIQELITERAEAIALAQRVEDLENLLNIKEAHGYETTGARVIAEVPSNFEWAVTVDRGSSDGIEVNMAVIGPSGLAGRVVRVTPSTAKVQLLIDPDSSVGVQLASSGEKGILEGNREDDLPLFLIDLEVRVRPGEPVVTSGVGGIFPPDLRVGEVSQVIPDDANLTQRIFVRPAVDFSRLTTVLIVLSLLEGQTPET